VIVGRSAFELSERHDLQPHHRMIAHATADALIATGRVEEALALTDRMVAESTAEGIRGLALGCFQELRARVAIAQDDGTSFRKFADLCAAEYRVAHNPALAAKHARLVQAAVERGLVPSTAQRPSSPPARDSLAPVLGIVRSRLLECQNGLDRARCALAILSEQIQPAKAFIYGLREGQATLLSSLHDDPEPAQLGAAIQRYLERELQFEEVTGLSTALDSDQRSRAESIRDGGAKPETLSTTLASDGVGDALYPVLLTSKREGQLTIAGVVALAFSGGRRNMPSAPLLNALADALITHDDVDPVTCIA
jgi:hypothetical protein